MKYFFEDPSIYQTQDQPDPVESYIPEGFDQEPLELDYTEADQPIAQVEEGLYQPEEEEDYQYDPTDDDQFVQQMLGRGYSNDRREPAYQVGNYYSPRAREPRYGTQSGEAGNAISPQEAYQYYVTQHGLPSHVAAGIVGNLQQESGLRTGAVGDHGTSKGLAQWHNDRWTGLQNTARRLGKDPHDPYFQLDYVVSEPGESSRMLQRAHQTRTPEEAALAVGRTYERYNPRMANEAGRQTNARNLVPRGQFGLDLLTGVGTQIGGQLVNGILENIFNPDAKYQQGVEGSLNLFQQQGMRQQSSLNQAKQAQQEQLTRYGQQGGSTFSQLKAFKPIQLGQNAPLSAASSSTYGTMMADRFGFSGGNQTDSFFKPGISNYMKEQGNNVTGQAYTNNAPLVNAQNADLNQSNPINLKGAGNWISKLLNGGGISLATQAAAALAAQQESAQIRASEWAKLADEPYNKVRTTRGITGAGLPSYAQHGIKKSKYHFSC